MSSNDDSDGLSEGLAILISSIVGIVVAVASVWYVTGLSDVGTEGLYRIDPTAGGGELTGVGADWTAGNTHPLLDLLVALTHAADVLMGAFILLMVFIHWGAFRRLAARMEESGRTTSSESVAADGGTRTDGPQSASNGSRSASDGPRSASDGPRSASDGPQSASDASGGGGLE